MFPAVLTRTTNGHVRRILIIALAAVLLMAVMGPALACPPGKAELKLVKVVENGDNPTPLSASAFPVSIDGQSATWEQVYIYDTADLKLIAETQQPGYTTTGWNCNQAGEIGIDELSAEITLTLDKMTTCTITNTWTPPEEPEQFLTLKKVVVGDAAASEWTLTATKGDLVISGLGPEVGPTSVPVGTFALSEFGGPANYEPGSEGWDCLPDGPEQTVSESEIVFNDSVTIGEDESWTCTITNKYVPPPPEYQITFVKQVCDDYSDIWKNPNGDNLEENAEELTGGDVGWGEVTPAAEQMGNCSPAVGWNFDIGATKVTGGSPGDLSHATDLFRTVTTGIDGTVTITLTPDEAAEALKGSGELWISEQAKAGYGFGALRCGNDILNGDNLEWVTFSATAGPTHRYCYAYNVAPEPPPDPAYLTLIKNVDNTGGGTADASEWILTAAGPDKTISGAGGVARTAIPAGTYDLTESTGPAGYAVDPAGWDCNFDDLDEIEVSEIAQSIDEVTLKPGDSKTCTITNTYIPPRTPDNVSLTIVKNTIGGDDTFSFVTGGSGLLNFDLTTEKGTKSRSFTLDAGTYTVEEDLTNLGVWGFTGLVCEGGVSSVADAKATITLAEGNSATCTFTNTIESVVKGTAQLGDTVWLDVNKNGVQDNGEVGYNGANVILRDAADKVVGTLTTATGAWVGFYKFVGLDAGTYTAVLDLSTIGTYKVSTANAFTITLAEGDDYIDADFGLYEETTPPTTVPPEETLPATGAKTDGMALLGLGLLLLGTLAILATRKRPTTD